MRWGLWRRGADAGRGPGAREGLERGCSIRAVRPPGPTIPRPGLFALLAAAFLLASVLPGTGQEPETLEPSPLVAAIVYQDGRPPETARLLVSGPVVWVSAQDLAALFRTVRYWRADVRKLTFQLASHEVALTVDSEVAVIDRTEAIHLDAPVLYREGRIYVPLSVLRDEEGKLLPWLPQPVTWNAGARELQVGSTPPRLLAVKASYARLDLLVSEPRDYRLVSTSRHRFIVRIPGVSVVRDSLSLPADKATFLGLAVTPVTEGVDVSFAVPDTVVGWQVVRAANPHRISVVVSYDERFVNEGRIDPFAEGLAGPAIDLRTIVIDPGHGGGDRGARSAGGLREADLTLGLARDLAVQLEQRLGVRTVLTRDDDRAVPLTARAETANMAEADLFLSLHFDDWPTGGIRGPRAVVARGEAPAPSDVAGSLSDLGFMPWGSGQAAQVGKARLLAEALVQSIAAAVGEPSRGVEEWPLPVIESARMPAVFLEVGALSSRGIDNKLSSGSLQARVVEAIVTAIDRYRSGTP